LLQLSDLHPSLEAPLREAFVFKGTLNRRCGNPHRNEHALARRGMRAAPLRQIGGWRLSRLTLEKAAGNKGSSARQ
jgi:hypothetical protein